MKILITGNSGFIGSHLQEKLENKGYQVMGLDNRRWSTRKMNGAIGDVRDKKLVDGLVSEVDEVYHLAAQINIDYGNEHAKETLEINVSGTLNILEACKKHNKRMVFASTSEVYGTAQSENISERHQLDAQSVYAASKLGADRLCKAYYDTYGVDARILRNFNTFGPYQRTDSYGGVIAIFVDRALSGKPPIINGDGEQQRDYIWIDDAIAGYELIAEAGIPGQPINIGSGTTVTVNQIAELVGKYIPCPKPIHTDPRPGEVRKLKADTTKAKSLGFSPTTDFEKNLYDYIQWRKESKSSL
jgi:UDP-glucose 4-epimerase